MSSFLWLLYTVLLLKIRGISSLSVSKSSTTRFKNHVVTNTKLDAKSRVAILDGSEWASVEPLLPESVKLSYEKLPSRAGYLSVITGKLDGTKVMGILKATASTTDDDDDVVNVDGYQVYKESLVTIPKNIKEMDAISTLIASLSGVYCGLPRLERVGGGTESFVAGKVVVLGGSDYAQFVANALATLGAQVYLVTNRDIHSSKLQNEVELMSPAVGELQLGFCSVIGEFDALVDTMSDELNRAYDDGADFLTGGSGVVSLLRKQHKCQHYVSTLTESQRIVRDNGVLFGPTQANQHVSDLMKAVDNEMSTKYPTNNDHRAIQPPKGFGSMVQTLLDNKVLYTPQKQGVVRGWSLQDFWELASWPRDSEGGANVRYGLPVLEDLDNDIFDRKTMISAPPLSNIDEDRFEKQQQQEQELKKEEIQKNPFVLDITTVGGLQQHVLSSTDKNCVVFMSAPYCRTCRYLTPAFTRMARIVSDQHDNVLFAKANTAGAKGKELGKVLDVEAVPAFCLFRKGQLYGTPLAVTRLPSKKLDKAVQLLLSGKEWDGSVSKDLD